MYMKLYLLFQVVHIDSRANVVPLVSMKYCTAEDLQSKEICQCHYFLVMVPSQDNYRWQLQIIQKHSGIILIQQNI